MLVVKRIKDALTMSNKTLQNDFLIRKHEPIFNMLSRIGLY